MSATWRASIRDQLIATPNDSIDKGSGGKGHHYGIIREAKLSDHIVRQRRRNSWRVMGSRNVDNGMSGSSVILRGLPAQT